MLVTAGSLVVVAVAALLLSVVTTSSPAAADVTVQRQGDRVRVVLEEEVSVRAVQQAMRDEGLDVEVRGQATGPSLQNRFVGSILAPGVVLEGGDGRSAAIASFPSDASVVLMLGVAAAPGEPYVVPTDATARGEMLAGIEVVGRPIGEVVPILGGLTTATVEFRDLDGGTSAEAPSTGTVSQVIGIADDRLVVLVTGAG